MLTGIHFLLTYMCNFECDHCFVYSGPKAQGTFTIGQISEVLRDARNIDTIEWIYFEGGEPFLYYPLMLEGIKRASQMGFRTGVVTNAYFATTVEDAELWLVPLAREGIEGLTVSDDEFHFPGPEDNPAKRALAAARKLGIPTNSICVKGPAEYSIPESEMKSGSSNVNDPPAGCVMFRGRAVEKLVEEGQGKQWQEFDECPHEDLADPSRVHVDPFGFVHLCQGLCAGNVWKTPLSKLINDYSADSHPICNPLVKGGPSLLTEEFDIDHDEIYADACHLCFMTRRSLIDRFPHVLAPRQIYGFAEEE